MDESIKLGDLERCSSLINKLNTNGFSIPFDPLVKLAIKYDREKILDFLIKKGAGILLNAALNDAAKHGSKRVLDYLLSKYAGKVDIDYQDKGGNTALHLALKEFIENWHDPSQQDKYKSFAESLLSKGARLDVKNDKNETPFDLLVNCVEKWIFDKAQRLTTVLELLNKCENKDTLKELIYKDSTSALNKLIELAVKCKCNEEVLISLVEKGARVSLGSAIKSGYVKVFNLLLEQSDIVIDDQDKNGDTALHHALQGFIRNESKYKGFVESLLGKGAKLDVKNNKNETPFDLLIDYVEKEIYGEAQRLATVLELLNKCKNKDGTSALNKLIELAVKYKCNEEVLISLVEKGARISLGSAIKSGYVKVFNLLLEQSDIVIDDQDKNGDTALHHALQGFIRNGLEYKGFVESLLGKGAKLDVKNNKNETPFDLLVNYVKQCSSKEAQRLTFVSELLSNCKDVLKKSSGAPALDKLMELAVKHDHEGILDLLVKNNTQILNTTLSGAVKHGSKRIFDCLLNKHADKVDIDYQDGEKNTALHYALQGLINAEYGSYKKDKYGNFVKSLLGKGAELSVKNEKGITPFDLLIDYVTDGKNALHPAIRLLCFSASLDECKAKGKLKELKYYKDGTPALDKLRELESDFDRSYSTSKNSKVPKKNLLPESTFNNSLWYVIGAIAGAAIGVALAYSITDAFSVIIAAVVIGSLLGMAITYGVSKCLEQPKVEHIIKEPYVS